MNTTLIVFLGVATAGAAVMSLAMARTRRVAPEIGAFLDGFRRNQMAVHQRKNPQLGAHSATRCRPLCR